MKPHRLQQANLAEPGWTPSALLPGPGGRQNYFVSRPHAYSTPPPFHSDFYEAAPAWTGSLRPSAQSHRSDAQAGLTPHHLAARVQSLSPPPAAAFGHVGSGGGAPAADGHGAVNLQYNSPMGLYSRTAAQEALSGQLYGHQTHDNQQ